VSRSVAARALLHPSAAAVVVIVVAAMTLSWDGWHGSARWASDPLFYEAQRLEIRGEPAEQARERVFFSDDRYIGARNEAFRVHTVAVARSPLTKQWVDYSARFYRRRWTVPAAAAALNALFGLGLRSLQMVSTAGYVALAFILFILLRLRFSALLSTVVVVLALSLDPLRAHSFIGGTDSWGLALLGGALIALHRGRDGRRRWLLLFALIIALLAFTRDDGVVAVVAAAVLAGFYRWRHGWLMAAVGIAATLPALLAFGAPARQELAYTFNHFQPTSAGWGFVLRHYPAALLSEQRSNARTLVLHHPFTGVFFAVGLLAVVAAMRTKDDYLQLACAAAAGGVVFLLLNPNPDGTDFRLELVLLPAAAIGAASTLHDVSKFSRVELRGNPRIGSRA